MKIEALRPMTRPVHDKGLSIPMFLVAYIVLAIIIHKSQFELESIPSTTNRCKLVFSKNGSIVC